MYQDKLTGKFYLVSNQPIFKNLSESEISFIASKVQIVEYSKNETIFRMGERNPYLFIVIYGLVQCFIPPDEIGKKEKVVEVFRKGDYFGIVSLLANKPHSLDSRALTDVRLLRIDENAFHEILKKSPALGIEFSKLLSRRLRTETKGEKDIFENHVIAVTGKSDILTTSYARELSDQIIKESGRKSIVITLNKNIGSKNPRCKNIDIKDIAGIHKILDEYCSISHYVVIDFPLDNFSLKNEIYKNSDNIHLVESREKLDIKFFDIFKQDAISKNRNLSLNSFRSIILGNPNEPEFQKSIKAIGRDISNVRIGLALGGGAALGLAQVGILKVLEKNNILIDMVSGTSIGSLIGGLWCSGMSASEIEKLCLEFESGINILKLMDVGIPVKGLLTGKKVKDFLKKYVKDMKIEEMKIPFRAVACNIAKREEVVLSRGSLVDAIRASTAIPGFFAPVIEKDGKVLVDGGVINPLPVSVLRQEGINRIIAINSMPSSRVTMKSDTTTQSILDITINSLYSLQYRIGKYAASESDVYLNPILENSSWYEFYRGKEFIELGEKSAESVIQEIRKLTKKAK